MSSSELQALFSNLRPRSRDPSSASQAPASFASPRQTSSSFISNTQIPSTPPPPFTAADESASRNANSSMNNQNPAISGPSAQNLLNLLNYGTSQSTANAAQQAQSPLIPTSQASYNPSISAADLVARFMSPVGTRPDARTEAVNMAHVQSGLQTSQNPLLELLNRQSSGAGRSRTPSQQRPQSTDMAKAQDSKVPEMVAEDNVSKGPSSAIDQSDMNGDHEKAISTEETKGVNTSSFKPIFTYKNPFEELQASRGHTSQPVTPAPAQVGTPSFTFAETAVPGLSTPTSVSARKKLTPKLRSQRSGTSPGLEQSPQPEDAATAGPQGSLTIRDKQPAVETPGVAQSIEIAESDPMLKSAVREPEGAEEEMKDARDASVEWEDVPDKASDRTIPVYNFPIRAFVSITLQLAIPSDATIRENGVMEISRLKKDFDQLDRSLAAATARYITYAFTKNGGLRIIRQDDGSDRHVFKHTHDRVFNVAFCTGAVTATPNDHQAVLGTGISGTVYYATVSKEGNDLFEKNQLDSESLVFPPFPQGDENTAGGVLKTRAKRSSRHPDFFAIGRGKSIQIIWPATAMSPKYGISETHRIVDVEKLYQDRPLQILTGKAGKDFTFSEDDSMIVSLDKTGRLRFWDIRALVDESNATAPRVNAVSVDTPVLSLSTASPAEKSWPTSVLFVDKARPYNKGGAQRYVLVGLRQNHTLQLWDIALGKAVQEINFPHENETDGICSVNYHPSSGIIVVGHPTRNSIFFIHLSAPRYSLSSSISQAEYVQRSVGKDPDLPKPESTACMSGIREISFALKGELRSIELLPMKASEDNAPLFELYVVHSKGVTCLGINREDLGWNADNKVIHSVDALKSGLVTVKEFKLGSVIEEPPRTASPPKETLPPPSKSSKKKSKKLGHAVEETINDVEEQQQQSQQQQQRQISPPEAPVAEPQQPEHLPQDLPIPATEPKVQKESKRAKKKAQQATLDAASTRNELREASPIKSSVTQINGEPSKTVDLEPSIINGAVPTSVGISAEDLEKQFQKIEQAVSVGFKTQFDTLYQNIHDDRAAQDQISNSRQETILRLVSDSLTNNVEKSLSRIVSQQIQQTVIPVVAQSASAEIGATLAKSLGDIIPQEIGRKLPEVLSLTLQSPHMTRTISDAVTQKLVKSLEHQMTDLVSKTIAPTFRDVAAAAAQQATAETEARLSGQIKQLQLDRATDNEKIGKLSEMLEGMAGILQTMSDSQVVFQAQILKERDEMRSLGASVSGPSENMSAARPSASPVASVNPPPARILSKEEVELEEIKVAMSEGHYEAATIRWLQSPQQARLFDDLFIRFTPDYLSTDVTPLVAFSVAVTVGNSLSDNAERRLEWISAAFDAIDPSDPELVDLAQHAPALITSLTGKLESFYMEVAEHSPGAAILRMVPAVAKKAREMRAAFLMQGRDSQGYA